MRVRIELPEKTSQVVAYLHELKGVEGEVWECGVHQGGTSRWIAFNLSDYTLGGNSAKTLRLFDSFCGRSSNSPEDEGCLDTPFDDTSLEVVKKLVPWHFVHFHQGYIPDTFKGLEGSKICLAYVDLDLYAPTVASLEFIIPRLSKQGVVIVDDYVRSDCWPGVKKAVDEVLSRHPEMKGKVVESSGFAVFHKR